MINSYTSSPTNVQINAVAQLMSDVGVALDMEYECPGSGTSPNYAADGLVNNFKYSSTAQLIDRSSYNTAASWMSVIESELSASTPRPMMLSITNTDGDEGHDVVIDGYQNIGGTDQVHINYGWSGQYDGYYDITNNWQVDYTWAANSEMIIIGIQPPTYTTTVTNAGNGSVTASQGTLTYSGSTGTASYYGGQTVTLTAVPQAGNSFLEWGGDCSGTTTTCQLYVNNNMNVTAAFQSGADTLLVAMVGTGTGTVAANTGTITWNGNNGTANYGSGTNVTLTATPTAPSTFTSWTNCDSSVGNVCNVTMSTPKNVTATFASACTYSASLTTGSTLPNPGAIGQAFSSLGGTGSVSVGTTSNCTWTASSSVPWITVTTSTSLASFTVAANTTGSSRTGTVTVAGQTFTITQSATDTCATSISPAIINVGAAGVTNAFVDAHVTSTTCTWSATSNTPWISIVSYGGGYGDYAVEYNVALNTTTNSRTGTFVAGGQTVTITQSGAPSFPLTVTDTGTGSGIVTSNPAGISCGSTCKANFNSSVTLSIYTNPGSTFTGWSGAGCSGTGTCVVPMTASTAVSANFNTTPVTYVVTPSAGAGGSISPSTPQTVSSGATQSFTLNPNTGYTIANVTGCGGTLVGNVYTTAAVTASCAVSATFTDMYAVTPTAETGGTISPAAVQSVLYNKTTKFTITPTKGYYISAVSGCGGKAYTGTKSSTSAISYTTGGITTVCSVTANFAIITYNVTPVPALGGTMSPAVAQAVGYNSTTSFTVTPNPGLHITSVKGCGGTTFTGTNSSTSPITYTTGDITAACTVTASFSVNTYAVTTNLGTGGSISPTSATVNYESMEKFTVTPKTGYSVASISGCGGTAYNGVASNTAAVTYTTSKVTSACVVAVTFQTATHAVTPSAGTGGTLSPTTVQQVNYNATTPFTVTPTAGYYIKSVSGCSGKAVTGTTASISPITYTTGGITAACTVTATFGVLETLTVTKAGVGSGKVTANSGTITWSGSTGTVSYISGTSIVLTAAPASGSTFSSWTGCKSTSGKTCTVSMTAAENVTATFGN